MDDVLFEVVTPAATAAARRLTTAAAVRAVIGSPVGDDALLDKMIDRVSAAAATYCNLAQDAIGTPPTFGRETCRATWLTHREGRDGTLLLPWRVPVISVTSIVEDGATLAGTDYRLRLGAILERMSDDAPIRWLRGKLVVVYVTGWDLVSNGAPPDLEAAAIDQVRAMYQGRLRDPTLLSESTESVGTATYAVAGGRTTGRSVLLPSVEAVLDGWRAVPM